MDTVNTINNLEILNLTQYIGSGCSLAWRCSLTWFFFEGRLSQKLRRHLNVNGGVFPASFCCHRICRVYTIAIFLAQRRSRYEYLPRFMFSIQSRLCTCGLQALHQVLNNA